MASNEKVAWVEAKSLVNYSNLIQRQLIVPLNKNN